MKRKGMMLMAMVILFCVGCSEKQETEKEEVLQSVKSGTYRMELQEGEQASVVPNLKVTEENEFIFSYDGLSSYLPKGEYEVEENILKAVTDDGKYTYRFAIEEDETLTFLAEGSSGMGLIDARMGVEVTDGAKFVLEE